MNNPFEPINARLTNLEALTLEVLQYLRSGQAGDKNDTTPYENFDWLCQVCKGIPPSTLRIKSAAGEIPGVVKFGKRVLYEKAVVLNWLRSQSSQPLDPALIEQRAEQQIKCQLNRKKGGVAA
ncbi:hypothetical protein [Spirosoma profusum]|uniref:hypothetical protein n=1 Tax=Spirosoma profusum TaxID=2771354 RepID=UPI001CC24E60|nr:hypothetical protein [Spirosoma profusum]